MGKIFVFCSGIGRSFAYLFSLHSLASALPGVIYIASKLLAQSHGSWNVMVSTLLMIFARCLRAHNSYGMHYTIRGSRQVLDLLTSFISLVNMGCLCDSLFSLDDLTVFWCFLSSLLMLWICFPKDKRYLGHKSRLNALQTVESFKKVIERAACICFVDGLSPACVEYAPIHAELSSRSHSSHFYLVDVRKSPEIASTCHVEVLKQPVLVRFLNGKETCRLACNNSNQSESLDRKFWYGSVKASFSL